MSEYFIAFVLESDGEWDIVQEFEAYNDNAANSHAEQNYSDRPWYVLDKNKKNINI